MWSTLTPFTLDTTIASVPEETETENGLVLFSVVRKQQGVASNFLVHCVDLGDPPPNAEDLDICHLSHHIFVCIITASGAEEFTLLIDHENQH